MINFIVSLLLGMLPEVLYLTLFLIYCKDIKEKKLKLFCLLAIGYIALIMICQYQFIFYIAYIIYSYLILKWLYKAHISNLFICSIGLSYMTLIAMIGYALLNSNYIVYYIVARILLYSIFIFKNKLNKLYNIYLECWNKGDNKRIKSITLRNISLVILNILIIILNIGVVWCSIISIK